MHPRIIFRLGLKVSQKQCTNVIGLSRCHIRSPKKGITVLTVLEFFLWLTNMCHPPTLCAQSDSIACNRCRHPKCTSVTEEKHVNTAHAYSLHCVHLTCNKVDYTILSKPILRQKSHNKPHFSTNWWDNLTPQHTEGEVWVWQPATIISFSHYLHSRSQRRMRKHCMRANIHRLTQKHTHVDITCRKLTGLS